MCLFGLVGILIFYLRGRKIRSRSGTQIYRYGQLDQRDREEDIESLIREKSDSEEEHDVWRSENHKI